MLLNHPKKGNPVICDNVCKFLEHYIKWDKPDIEKKYCMVSSTCGIVKSYKDRHREKYKLSVSTGEDGLRMEFII